ncbi:LysE/ArgO family amino acid transporter [Glutamicibacter sp. X7]
MLHTALLGLTTGLSLIIAIGAQNAFVLRQGIRKEHVLTTVLICSLSDAVLITAGVSGIGYLIERAPVALIVARLGGAAFLVGYAVLALRRAIAPGSLDASAGSGGTSRKAVVLTTLALTWLNPHVYLDTVLLLGSLGAAQGESGRWAFGFGAVLGSILWFSALGFAARYLSTIFARPLAWRILDGLIALLMSYFAVLLLLPLITEGRAIHI